MEKLSSVFKKYLFLNLIILICFVILYPKFPLLSVPGTYVAIRIEDVYIAIILVLWGVANLNKFKQLIREPIYQLFLIFWIIGLLSFVSAAFVTHSVKWHLGFLHTLRRIEYMSLFIVAATTVKSIEQVKTILKIGLIISIIVSLYGFGQVFLKFPVVSTTNKEFSKGIILYLTSEARVNSTFAGHYDLAIFLTIILSFLSSLFFFYKKIWQKTLFIFTSLLSFVLLGMTAARLSFFATLAALVISLWINKKYILIGFLILGAVGTVGVIPELRHRLVATFTVNFLGGGGPKYNPPKQMRLDPNTRLSESSRAAILREAGGNIATVASDIAPGEPINTTELGVYRSYGIRFNVEWPRAMNGFYKNPILGTGYSSLGIATDNDLFRSLGEVGLLGTLALCMIFVVIFKRMIVHLRKTVDDFEKKYIIGALCALLGVLITSIFIDVLEASKVAILLWFLLGITWALTLNFKDAKND